MSASRNSWSLLFVMFRPSRFNSGLSQSRARLTMRAVRLLAVLACTSLLFTAVSCQDADDELPPLLQACRAQVRCPSGTGYFRDRTVRFRAVRARPSPRLTPRSPTLARFLLSQLKDVTRKFKDNSAVVTKYHEMSDKLHASIAEKMALKAEVAALEEQLAAVASRPDPGVTELFVQLVSATWNLTSEVAPAYAAEIYRDVATVVGPAAAAAADRVAGAVSAARPVVVAAATRAEPAARAAVVIARRGAESAAVFAVRAFDAAVSELAARASTVEALAPHATEANARIVVSLLLSPLALWVAFGAIGGRLFGSKRIQVPKKVAASSVPLRTPSPEPRRPAPPTRRQPGSPPRRSTRIRGDPRSPPEPGEIRSPEGDVLRFA